MIPRYTENAGKVVVVDVGSKWCVLRMLAEYGRKQVLGGLKESACVLGGGQSSWKGILKADVVATQDILTRFNKYLMDCFPYTRHLSRRGFSVEHRNVYYPLGAYILIP